MHFSKPVKKVSSNLPLPTQQLKGLNTLPVNMFKKDQFKRQVFTNHLLSNKNPCDINGQFIKHVYFFITHTKRDQHKERIIYTEMN